jgi:pyruvate formate lyase activating enzyme
VEAEELERIAKLLCAADPAIPFTLLAFFPEYHMKYFRSPTVREMVDAYTRVKDTGLRHVRLGNLGIFAPTEADQDYLAENVGPGDY